MNIKTSVEVAYANSDIFKVRLTPETLGNMVAKMSEEQLDSMNVSRKNYLSTFATDKQKSIQSKIFK